MKIFKNAGQCTKFRKTRFRSGSLGFVPTMGALHKGHLSLIRCSMNENKYTAVSIFLNPSQFNDPADLATYPKTREPDLALLEAAGVDLLFAPDYGQVYPDDYHFRMMETELSRQLCGARRPGHFTGVLTVVLKLFNIIHADRAYFGEKDYQQYLLIRNMARAFFLETQIVSCPTIREEDGLAVSSRNQLLTAAERKLAPEFYRLLNSGKPIPAIVESLGKLGFVVDYIEDCYQRRFGAVFLGNVRLIDNLELAVKSRQETG